MSVFIIIFFTAVAALFAGVFEQGKFARYLGIIGLAAALFMCYQPEPAFFVKYEKMFSFGINAALFTKISVIATLLIFLLGGFAFNNHRSHQSELYALMLFALSGGILLFAYQNLVTLFLGIEILSIPLYVMAGSNKTNMRSVEASMKYFLMGAFATGFLMFGVALVYGSTGSLDLNFIHQFSATGSKNIMLLMGAVLMLCAMAFKVSLAPFHMWSPDVYQGSPSIITAFMASVVKISAFYGLFRLMSFGFNGLFHGWINIVGVLVIITMLLANAMGLAQTNAKRMLAYSSISHAGYIALIFFGTTTASASTLAFYLLAYALATVGVFACLVYVEKIKKETSYHAFKGLGRSEPVLAIAASVCLLSMAGIPLTAGFIGKFGLFSQAIKTAPFMVLMAVLGSAVSIAYYLRLMIAMFFFKDEEFPKTERATFTYNAVAVVIVLALFTLGVWPDAFRYIFELV